MHTFIYEYMMDLLSRPLSRQPCRKNPLLLHTLSRERRPGPVTYQKVLTHCHINFQQSYNIEIFYLHIIKKVSLSLLY